MSTEATGRQKVSIVLLTLLCLIVASLIFTVRKQDRKQPEVSPVVVTFLDRFVCGGVTETGRDYTVLTEVFNGYEGMSLENLVDTELCQTVISVFETLSDDEHTFRKYIVNPVSDKFVIVALYTEDDEALPPPVGLWYATTIVDGVEKIDDWYMCRLLPLSRYSEETTEEWYETFH